MFILQITRWLYNTFAGAMTPSQIAYGMCLGLFLALMPFGFSNAHTWMVLSLVLVTRASIGLFMLTAAIAKPIMMAGGDSLIWHLGHRALHASALEGFWKTALNLPVVALVEFDRYRVMGGFLAALLLSAVLFMPIRQAVVYFRERIQPRADQYRIVRWWRGFFLNKALTFVFGSGR